MEQPVVNISGERVALGPLRRDLLETYQRWFNDFGTDRTQGDLPGPRALERVERFYERRAGDLDSPTFLIYVLDSWQPIGFTWLADVDHRHRTAGYAISIGEPAARGQGYGTEVTRLMLDYAFTALGLHNVLLEVYEPNIAGQRAYAKAGFRECGRRHASYRMGGRTWDVIYMECLATDFRSPVLGKVFVPDTERE
jgi:RimJ/RimL family protein N-acetyltransferase